MGAESCCSTKQDTKACPACGQGGRLVPAQTLDALLLPGSERHPERYRFCASPGCEVAWFGAESGHRIPVSACRVRIGQKERSPDRSVCYCFGYSAQQVQADPGLFKHISAKCRQGLDRCEVTNPQGSCCLGNVRAALEG